MALPFLDPFGRPISYLRISVTDRCNFRCLYCLPEDGIRLRSPKDILRYEEIEMIAQAAARLGTNKLRLTGGEPLVRKGLVHLVKMLASVPGIDDVALSTNGSLLRENAETLAKAGLKRVNVSLDSLRPERFALITRGGRLEDTLAGIKAATESGLSPVKVNMVVMAGINDDEILDFARLSLKGWHVRFIELMPIGVSTSAGLRYVPGDKIKGEIEKHLGELRPAKVSAGGGPARYYRLADSPGTIGFISPISQCFCSGCNRLRLTADGRLRPCLFSGEEIDLRTPLRNGASREELCQMILDGVRLKPQSHRLNHQFVPQGRCMSEIGG